MGNNILILTVGLHELYDRSLARVTRVIATPSFNTVLSHGLRVMGRKIILTPPADRFPAQSCELEVGVKNLQYLYKKYGLNYRE